MHTNLILVFTQFLRVNRKKNNSNSSHTLIILHIIIMSPNYNVHQICHNKTSTIT